MADASFWPTASSGRSAFVSYYQQQESNSNLGKGRR